MGIDYHCTLAVGYQITTEELRSLFGKKKEVVETGGWKYDPYSGKKIDPSHHTYEDDYYEFDGFEHGTAEELVETIATRVGAVHSTQDIDYYSGEETGSWIIGLPLDTVGSMDHGRISVGGSYEVEKLIANLDRLVEIGTELAKLGLTPGKPVIAPCLTIS